jgi:hypothetical protein
LLGYFGSKEDDLSGAKFTNAFKRDAVAQVEDQGLSADRSRHRQVQADWQAVSE